MLDDKYYQVCFEAEYEGKTYKIDFVQGEGFLRKAGIPDALISRLDELWSTISIDKIDECEKNKTFGKLCEETIKEYFGDSARFLFDHYPYGVVF